jgi:sec-independent protein translocase protein TatA
MLPNVGMGEMLVIGVVAVLLFGANRIPEVARSLGRSVNAFKSGLKEGMDPCDKT